MGTSPAGRFTEVDRADMQEAPTRSVSIPEQASGERRATARWRYASAVEVARNLNSRR
ncbi:MAG: hypothetical protein ACTHOK_08445 [Nocardioidaceae bacterium]